MPLLPARTILACSLLLALTAGEPRASTVFRLDVEQLADLSAIVVVGVVRSVEVRPEPVTGATCTYATIAVTRVLKGAPGPEVVILQLGGRLGDVTVHVEGAPRFAPGEEVVVFGAPRGDEFLVTGLHQGKWTVETGPDGRRLARRQAAGAGVEVLPLPASAGPASEPATELTLDELVRRVTARAATSAAATLTGGRP